MADRFFVAELPRDGQILLVGDEAKHLSRVARRVPGDRVEIFDGRGTCVEAEVVEIRKDQVTLAARKGVPDRAAPLSLALFVAPPKGDRFDWIVEKATELGVDRLVPLRASRSVVDPRSAKLDRLRRVILEASKQCGRSRLMILDEPVSATGAFRAELASCRLIAEAGGRPPSNWPALARESSVALAIGPEGGWTEEELAVAASCGWITAGLGSTRLRVETAAIVGAAVAFSRVEGGGS